jgi:hypothetical protein
MSRGGKVSVLVFEATPNTECVKLLLLVFIIKVTFSETFKTFTRGLHVQLDLSLYTKGGTLSQR